MIRAIGVAVAVVGVGLGLASSPPATADLYEDFGVGSADRQFFEWLVDDGNFVLFPSGSRTEGSYKPLLRLAYDTCGLVDRIGVDSAFDFMVAKPMPRQSRPMTRDQANRWLYGAVPNLCPEAF